MSFGDDVEKFAKLAVEQADTVARAATAETGRRLIARTPVRTGHLRANWQLAIDAPPTGELAIAGFPGSPAGPPQIPALAAATTGRIFYLANNVPYGVDLEIGKGGRPPLGLLTLAELEFPAVVAAAAKTTP